MSFSGKANATAAEATRTMKDNCMICTDSNDYE